MAERSGAERRGINEADQNRRAATASQSGSGRRERSATWPNRKKATTTSTRNRDEKRNREYVIYIRTKKNMPNKNKMNRVGKTEEKNLLTTRRTRRPRGCCERGSWRRDRSETRGSSPAPAPGSPAKSWRRAGGRRSSRSSERERERERERKMGKEKRRKRLILNFTVWRMCRDG